MSSFITPIELTRSYSVKPAAGLRYGNFEGVENLPPTTVSGGRLGAHSFTELNNQQIVKTVCEWSGGWRPWQQKVLLCGIVDRCSIRQIDVLATTLEPVRHRDYSTAAKHHYPRTPLTKTRQEWTEKKKKKRKRKVVKEKHEVVAPTPGREDIPAPDEGLAVSDYMAFSPESVRSVVPSFCTEAGQRELEEKLYIESLKQKEASRKAKWEKLERKRKKAELKKAQIANNKNISNKEDGVDSTLYNNVPEFANVLADKIICDSLPKSLTYVSLSDTYAEDLADTILQDAVTSVVGQIEERQMPIKGILQDHSSSAKAKGQDQRPAKSREISFVIDPQYVTKEPDEQLLEHDNELPRSESPVQVENGIIKVPGSSDKSGTKSVRPTSLVRIKSPTQDEVKPAVELPVKRESSGQSGVSRSMSALTRASIGNIRYQLFGANSISTPDFFKKTGINVGPMQRELRQGEVYRPSRLGNVPVPAPPLYKSVRWWPESPRDGKIFFPANQQDLSRNFREQLQQVWNWLERWEDYERITLLKELLKLCAPENLAFFSSHIQQHLRDARDVNRLPDKLILYILSFLSADDVRVSARVSRRWRFLCATDDLWMIKCHELGLDEGIESLEKMIVLANRQKMGIDWRLAHDELSRITRLMKARFNKQKAVLTKKKAVGFKEELEMLQKKESSTVACAHSACSQRRGQCKWFGVIPTWT